MHPLKIKGSGRPLDAPTDWNEEQNGRCAALAVRRDTIGGLNYMTSAWEANDTDVDRLVLNAPVELCIQGVNHPVVKLSVGAAPNEGFPVLIVRSGVTPAQEPYVQCRMLFPLGGQVVEGYELMTELDYAGAVASAIRKIEKAARNAGLM